MGLKTKEQKAAEKSQVKFLSATYPTKSKPQNPHGFQLNEKVDGAWRKTDVFAEVEGTLVGISAEESVLPTDNVKMFGMKVELYDKKEDEIYAVSFSLKSYASQKVCNALLKIQEVYDLANEEVFVTLGLNQWKNSNGELNYHFSITVNGNYIFKDEDLYFNRDGVNVQTGKVLPQVERDEEGGIIGASQNKRFRFLVEEVNAMSPLLSNIKSTLTNNASGKESVETTTTNSSEVESSKDEDLLDDSGSDFGNDLPDDDLPF